jgi:hypothetical protein
MSSVQTETYSSFLLSPALIVSGLTWRTNGILQTSEPASNTLVLPVDYRRDQLVRIDNYHGIRRPVKANSKPC